MCMNLNMQNGRSSTDGGNQLQERRPQKQCQQSCAGLCSEQRAKPRVKKHSYKSLAALSAPLLSKRHLLMYESIQASNFLVVTIKFLCLCSTQGYPGHQLLLHLPNKKKGQWSNCLLREAEEKCSRGKSCHSG